MEYYAHSLPGKSREQWQLLVDHLENVAALASEFADSFQAREWGYTLGLCHDLGKFSMAFQTYLEQDPKADYHQDELEQSGDRNPGIKKVDHSTAGAKHAVAKLGIPGYMLAYAIAGHHAGLLDGRADHACLDSRLKKPVEPWKHGLAHFRGKKYPDVLPAYIQKAIGRKATDPQGSAFSLAFFTRMLFSCLVDADYMDTERFMDVEKYSARPVWPSDILEKMMFLLDKHIESLATSDTQVNAARRKVRSACIEKAECEQGLFSLTVPTGGGKTLSSLTFALKHAMKHDLRRIIYVIPFTSIIEQNAAVFRSVLRQLHDQGVFDPVLEHHCAIDTGAETLESRLAAENWDAPLVVTTSVQFYESLFSNRTSKCRKLHNLVRSVIVLDEAQKIPVDYLKPCILALRELASNYRSSVILCTATQPAIYKRDDFPIGLEDVEEIIPEPRKLYESLKRVSVVDIGMQEDKELSGRLREHEQVLCIVNTRRHARRLFALLQDQEETFHLSAAMCPEHRSKVFGEIRRRLKSGENCRVVTTQLVEAGVDLDFPVVFRSLAGLDSVAQAAGRCNRNGLLRSATTHVFKSEHPRAEAFLRDTTNAASQLLGGGNQEPIYEDLLSLDAIEHYFRLYYWQQKNRWDRKGILDLLHMVNDKKLPFQFAYQQISKRFKLIEDTGETVIVPWEGGETLCRELRESWKIPDRRIIRGLQRYTVQIPKRIWQKEVGRSIELVHERFPVLASPELHYDEKIGLVLDREDFDSELFIN